VKAISILQPWASLIVLGAKKFETRSWKTEHRGPILIHSGRRFQTAQKNLCTQQPFFSALKLDGKTLDGTLPLGHIIGVAILEDCIHLEEGGAITATERAFGDFGRGRYAWHMICPQPLAVPLAHKGMLGVFNVDNSLLAACAENRGILMPFLAGDLSVP